MSKPQTYIAHFDLDTFFVSVELLNNPELKGKPVIVGGSKERGVVSTCSYEARKFGVKSGMAMKLAMQLCPQAIIARGTRGQYSKYSKWVTDIIASKAPKFEKASIDEFYLDLTGMDKFYNVLDWTIALREQIIEETKLPISFGLGSNKMIAKIATDEAKPNGFLFIQPGLEQSFLAPLPVNKISGVGDYTYKKLQALQIYLIGDLLKHTPEYLEEKLGSWGVELYNKAQGKGSINIGSERVSKSISCENTFNENISNEKELLIQLIKQVERVAFELREEKLLTSCVAVKIRYPNFETTSKQITIDFTLSDDVLLVEAKKLFNKLWIKNNPVRLLGVKLSGLQDIGFQTNIFDDITVKSKLYNAVDIVKNRFGKTALQKASTVIKK